MRLINTKTLQIEDFWKAVPVYAILSHTWGDEEVTYQEMIARQKQTQPSIDRKPGFIKIKKSCEQALSNGFSYVWVDTCCIDKTSSSELSEAINSMFDWYRNAEVCYAFLADVSASENAFNLDSQFRRSRWFTRGWTLQELLAPLSVVFYDKDWVEIGTKASLREVITNITNISKQVLLANHGGEISIAERMSWAVNRQTTRTEDIAYCLLGLFGINMPILYGEGMNAFTRLQREIISTSDDHTIFAWSGSGGVAGLLAKSPSDFAPPPDQPHLARKDVDNKKSPYSITNVGLSIELPLQRDPHNPNQYRALLNCTRYSGSNVVCGIYLSKDKEGQYVRARTKEVFTENLDNLRSYKRERIYIKERVPSQFDVMEWMRPRNNYQFLIKSMPDVRTDGFAPTQFYPSSAPDRQWSIQGTLYRFTLAHSGSSGGILFESHSGQSERFVVMLGMHNYNVWCDIVTNIPQSDTLEKIAKSYYGQDRPSMIWENLDRSCKRLTLHDKYVFVAARKGLLSSNHYQYLVDITITTTPPNASAGGFAGLGMITSQAAYRFQVVFDPSTWDVVELPKFDAIAWHRQVDQSLILGIEHSGTSGIMILRERAHNAQVAVLLGVHNYKAWSDVIPNVKAGATKEIRDSYYRSGPGSRGSRLWAWDTDIKVPFVGNLFVEMKTTEHVEKVFVSKITLERG